MQKQEQKKVLVYGADGWIGNILMKLLCQDKRFEVHKGTSRVDDMKQVSDELDKLEPNHVISLIGRVRGNDCPNIDYLEKPGKLRENIRDNLFAPLNLAMSCALRNIHLTYFGTGCIFEYDSQHTPMSRGFTTEDKPNFFGSSYSVVKGFTDQLMHHAFLDDYILNVRIRMPIVSYPHPNNFITKIVSYKKVIDVPNSVTVLDNLLPYLLDKIYQGQTGTLNLVNPGVISHGEILQMYRDIVDPDFKWSTWSVEEQNTTLGNQRSNNCLATNYDPEDGIPNARDALQAALQTYAQHNYKPRVIMITGGCGFIGSHVLEHLFNTYPDYHFVNVDAMTTCANPLNISEPIRNSPRYTFVMQDIRDPTMHKTIIDHRVDTIMHFAAETHVDNSFKAPLQFTQTNVYGTHNLLQCVLAVKPQIKRFIHVSTDEVYGETVDSPHKRVEQSLLNPTNPYAATKAASELIVKSYHKSFQLPIIITRGNNVYGSRQYPEKVVPKFISLLLSDQPCTIHGQGKAKRSFMHVRDVAAAFDIILHRGKLSETYNIGVNEEHTVLDVAHRLKQILGKQHLENIHVDDRNFNDMRYHIDCSKLKALGWQAEIDIQEGLQHTCKWYAAHLQHHWSTEMIDAAIHGQFMTTEKYSQ